MVVVAANEAIQSADYTSGLVTAATLHDVSPAPAVPRDLLSWHPPGEWQGDSQPRFRVS